MLAKLDSNPTPSTRPVTLGKVFNLSRNVLFLFCKQEYDSTSLCSWKHSMLDSYWVLCTFISKDEDGQ